MADKSTSLLDLGYVIELGKGEKDAAGLEVVAVVYKPFFIKKTKRGKYKAYRQIDGKVESAVDGMYGLQPSGNGDFTGKRPVVKQAVAQ